MAMKSKKRSCYIADELSVKLYVGLSNHALNTAHLLSLMQDRGGAREKNVITHMQLPSRKLLRAYWCLHCVLYCWMESFFISGTHTP